ncbi:MAG: tRNA adenosine(34) deaminase TadA [Gammaproteobacteria bacterium]|nr:tRNA adenosine(34) deaminase TadA [Gammaproteobacteria bacterium]
MTASIQSNFSEIDSQFMQRALTLAKTAAEKNEVPIGAVLVLENKIIGEGFNAPISMVDPTAHAEMIALRNAANQHKNYRLIDSTLYVTLEPCLMCAGAMIQARVARVVFGASDVRWQARQQCGNHTVKYEGGLLAEESTVLLKEFFKKRRD